MIVEQTNLYATQVMGEERYATWEAVHTEEIWAYFGFMILMGINWLPALSDYWRKDSTYHYAPVADRIPRDRFFAISRYLHFMDNRALVGRDDPSYDKLGKVRPVLNILAERFLACFAPHCQNAIDEGMIPFKGRSSMKQYMPKKPTKRGFKAWVRADSVKGYVCEAEIYTGKQDGEPEIGLGGNVVKRLTRNLIGKWYHVYCDNFFTSLPLFTDLLKDGIYACGTYNPRRKCFPKEIRPSVKKGIGSRGSTLYREREEALLTVWQDTKCVTVLSTNAQPNVEQPVRRKQKDGTRTLVPCPESVRIYNEFMGGVDRNDQLQGYYQVRLKSRKCYKYIFWFFFDVAIVNAFILFRYSPGEKKNLTMKDFRVELAKQMIGTYNSRKYRGRPSSSEQTASRTRRIQLPHYPIKVSTGRCGYCSQQGRRTSTTWYCEECRIRLCHTGHRETDCFLTYHLSHGLYNHS